MIRAYYNKAYVQLELKKYKEAVETYSLYETYFPNDTNSLYLKAFALEHLG